MKVHRVTRFPFYTYVEILKGKEFFRINHSDSTFTFREYDFPRYKVGVEEFIKDVEALVEEDFADTMYDLYYVYHGMAK